MKKSGGILLVLFFILVSCEKREKEPILNIVTAMNNFKSVHFEAMQKYYYQGKIDTTYTPFEAWVIRDKKDSLRNGYVWIDNNYRPYHMIYEKGDFYLAIPPKKTTVLYKNFKEDFISPSDWIDFFLKPQLLPKILKESGVKTNFSEVSYKGEQCDKLDIIVPESDKGEQRSFTYILSKKHHMPLWSKMELKAKDQVYIDELTFSDIEFNKLDINNLRDKQKLVLKENPIERNGSNSEIDRLERMIHIGEKAPLFEGKFYGTEDVFNLKNYIGKNVIVVDFWYTHCPPCVKAMPALSELYSEYKDQGLKIFGLNSVDNRPGSLDNLDKFLNNRKLSYDVVMTKPEVDKKYKISGYPTLYIVDKKGNISYVEVGYDKEKFKEFKRKIAELLLK